MGRYINQDAVIVRLRGKVKTTDDPDNNPDRMSLLLLNRLINEAEGSVEQDLSTRYLAPFQTLEGADFKSLPVRPTQEVIRTLCELLAVVRVLETDFGKGSGLDGMNYARNCQDRYEAMVYGDKDTGGERRPGLLSLRKNSYNTYRLPPLPGLHSNYQNGQADTGFDGFVGRTDGHGNYASQHINDPSHDYYNGIGDGDC